MTDIVERLRDEALDPAQDWLREAADEITRLRAALDAWACACRVDVTMEGPVFRGIERSAAARAWKATLAALEGSK